MDIRKLSIWILNQLEQLLQLEKLFLILLDSSGNHKLLLPENNKEFIKLEHVNIIKYIAHNTDLSIMSVEDVVERGICFEPIDKPELKQSGIVLIGVIKSQESDVLAYLILGRKKSGLRYSYEDIDLIQTIITQFGLAIDRIRLMERLVIKKAESKKLQELNKLKSYFVSSVSHELQTPLTSIKMFSELLQTKKNISKEEKKEYLEIIEGESERLSRLVNNVLDFSKIEKGKKEYRFRKLNLNEVVQNVMLQMKYQLNQNDFRLDTRFSDYQIILQADEDALKEALMNLISNVIKYSPEEKYLYISTLIEKNYAVLKVSDRGIGISTIEQKHIFESFYRSKVERIKSIAGTGLGLALVKHIVEAHCGKVELESTQGEGSTFIIKLPIEVNDEKNSDN